MNDYLQHATDPAQYDSDEIQWESVGSNQSPSRQFFRESLERVLDIKGKSVLDIGSGTGQLFDLLKQHGATYVQGVEPSTKNVEISRKRSPEIKVTQATLEEMSAKRKFDVAVAVMVFEHIADIDAAFSKIHSLLHPHGTFYLIFADKEYNLTPRFGYTIDKIDIGDEASVAKITRSWGTVYDILRPVHKYTKASERSGFHVKEHLALKPTEKLIATDPKYKQIPEVTITHLLVLQKSSFL